MSKMRKIKRDHMRALLSEVLPYEAPLPFSALELFRFLKRINFEWTEKANRFTVSTRKMTEADKWWLRTLFDQVDIQLTPSNDGLTTVLIPNGDRPRRVWAAPVVRSTRYVNRFLLTGECKIERTRPESGSRARNADEHGYIRTSSH